MQLHWHPSETSNTAVPACERVTCVSGSLHVYVADGIDGNYDKLGYAGMTVKFAPGQRISWNQTKEIAKDPLTVDFVAHHTLWRNYCSAILDADIFPRLASTPWWLKALFASLAFLPSWRDKLLRLMLSIQLQAIFFAHDFHVYHGRVPVTWLWMYQPFGERPPAWAKRLQLQSMLFIARAVMTAAYYASTLFLGMRGEYPEYTPTRDHRDEKR
jgi:hypothetical protein